jgi:hypothetical protein
MTTAQTTSSVARDRDDWFPDLPSKLQDAALHAISTDAQEQKILASTPPGSSLDGIHTFGQSTIVLPEGKKVAPATLYFTFRFKTEDGKDESYSESVPGRVMFTTVDGEIQIVDILPDLGGLSS